MMWWFIIASAIFVGLGCLLSHVPSPPNFAHQSAYLLIFGSMPRIFIAGIIGSILGLSANNYIVSRMKIWMHGKNYWVRSTVSTCGGEVVYNVVAYPIMYLGRIDGASLLHIFISVMLFKIAMTAFLVPFECCLARYLKVKEKINCYDYNVNYNIFKFSFKSRAKSPQLKIIKPDTVSTD